MSHLTKVAGTWRNSKPYTKVAGTWKLADYVYNKVGGRWYTSFVKGGLVDKSWDDRDQSGQFGSAGGSLQEIALQSDGKILLGGDAMTSWNGVTLNYFARLNSNSSLDTTFNNNLGTGFNSTIYSVIPQSDGKTLIGGAFTTLNAVAAAGLVRLNSDGTRDATLDTATGAGGNIYGAAIQSDGKIVIGGSFTAWKGTTAGYFTRINSDGSLDTSFNSNLGTGANGAILSVKVQSDGKIIVAGQFSTWNGVTVANNIVRLESTGVRDTAFTVQNGTGTGLDQTIRKVVIQSDGKILLGGVFSSWNGTTVGRIVRLNSNGSLDTAFTTNNGTGATNTINSIVIQTDGIIIISGTIQTFNKIYVGTICRLNSNGTSYETLSAFANNPVNAIAIQSDGKILLGGVFTFWNGISSTRIARLNSDGTLDTAFITNTGTGANSTINSIAIQSDSKIIVAGVFSTWNGTTVGRIVRLNSDGTRDTTFTTNNGTGANGTIEVVVVDYMDRIIVGGAFTGWNGSPVGRIARLSSAGVRDTVFTTNNGFGATTTSSSIFAIAIDSASDDIIVGGSFTNWNGTAGIGRIVRLIDGIRDTSFNASVGTGANNSIFEIVIQSDSDIIVAGAFSSWSATAVGRIVRLNSDGTRDTTFTSANGAGANSTINGIAIQSDDKIIVGGAFTFWNGISINRIVRLNYDGTRDTSFTTNNGAGANGTINAIVVQPDKKILAGGSFSTFRISSEFRRFFVRIGGEDAS